MSYLMSLLGWACIIGGVFYGINESSKYQSSITPVCVPSRRPEYSCRNSRNKNRLIELKNAEYKFSKN